MKESEMSNVSILKSTIRRFPGITIGGLKRQIGKTQTILELIHEDHGGAAWYFTFNRRLCEVARMRYQEMYGHQLLLPYAYAPEQMNGSNWPVYVDEYQRVGEAYTAKLIDAQATRPLLCRIGTDL
jgi:hypothetical protein